MLPQVTATTYTTSAGIKTATFDSPIVESASYLGVLLDVTLQLQLSQLIAESFPFTFSFEAQLPGIVTFITPTSGTRFGGTQISMGISGFPPISTASELSIVFGELEISADSIDQSSDVLLVETNTPGGLPGSILTVTVTLTLNYPMVWQVIVLPE